MRERYGVRIDEPRFVVHGIGVPIDEGTAEERGIADSWGIDKKRKGWVISRQ